MLRDLNVALRQLNQEAFARNLPVTPLVATKKAGLELLQLLLLHLRLSQVSPDSFFILQVFAY